MTDTELRIIESAKKVFSEKGLENAKMQDIADRAGISRTSLNYYYRTKENLFYALVEQIFDTLLPKISLLSIADVTMESVINQVVDIYFDILGKNEMMPHFLILQIQSNPKIIYNFVTHSAKAQAYLSALSLLFEKNITLRISKNQALCVFFGLITAPFLLSPLVELYLPDGEETKEQYMEIHKETVKSLLKVYLEAQPTFPK
jgi:AcrR family transcriptional regulator